MINAHGFNLPIMKCVGKVLQVSDAEGASLWEHFAETVLRIAWYTFLILVVVGLLPIIIVFSMGGVPHYCGMYGNKYIRADCTINDYGLLPLYRSVCIGGECESKLDSLKYMLIGSLVTINEDPNVVQYIPLFAGNFTVVFKNRDSFENVEQKFALRKATIRECNVLEWALSQVNGSAPNRPDTNPYLQRNGASLFIKEWDPHVLTLELHPFCGYVHLVYISVISGYIIIPSLAGIIAGICDCYLRVWRLPPVSASKSIKRGARRTSV